MPHVTFVNLYPHTITYLIPLIEEFSTNGWHTTVLLRTKSFSVGDTSYTIDGETMVTSNGGVVLQKIDLSQNISSIQISSSHEYSLIYFLKYFSRQLRNVISKKHFGLDDHFFRKQLRLLPFLSRVLFYTFSLNSNRANLLLKNIESLLPPSKRVKAHLESLNTDLVFVSPANWENRGLYLSTEIEYIKSALKAGTKAVVYQLSLDNFFAREIIHVEPDILLSWTERSGELAERLGLISNRTQKYSVGSLYFEARQNTYKYLLEENKTKCDEASKIILYAGSASGIIDCEIEHDLAKKCSLVLEKLGFELRYRPHPANVPKHLKASCETSFPVGGELVDLYSILERSFAVIGISTTLLHEASYLGLPVIFNRMTNFNIFGDFGMRTLYEKSANFTTTLELEKLVGNLNLTKFSESRVENPSKRIFRLLTNPP